MTVQFTAPRRDWVLPAIPPTPLQLIGQAAAREFGVKPADIFSGIKVREVAHARQAAFYVAREITDASLPQIGRTFRRDHTTVIHGLQAVEARMTPRLRTQLDRIKIAAMGGME
jgi:chromosomal replication initiator protein